MRSAEKLYAVSTYNHTVQKKNYRLYYCLSVTQPVTNSPLTSYAGSAACIACREGLK
jgi:hypothetical protein